MSRRVCGPLIGSVILLCLASESLAEQIHVAVASNALAAIRVISTAFREQTGHELLISSGSTGKLYAQIVNGAPFDVFLAANESEPKKLEQDQHIVAGSRFTYALGTLVVWSSDGASLTSYNIKDLLGSKSVNRIAIANPKTAPYGFAAQQVLQGMGIWETLQEKIIRGENVSQAYQFTTSGNSQIGFIAKSQVIGQPGGSLWEVPQALYTPIKQQAVLLKGSRQKTAAGEFISFIKRAKARRILTEQFGYGIENSEGHG